MEEDFVQLKSDLNEIRMDFLIWRFLCEFICVRRTWWPMTAGSQRSQPVQSDYSRPGLGVEA